MRSANFLNLDMIYQIENNVYGHSRILRRFCQVSDNFIIPGIIQHGWNFGAGFGYHEDRSEYLQKFIWSKANFERIKTSDPGKYQIIGAPWLYLPTEIEAKKKTLDLCLNRKLVFVQHQTSSIKHDPALFVELINNWKSEFGLEAVFCLHPRDYYDTQIHNLFEINGLSTITMGSKGILPHHDSSFLYNLKSAISVSKEIVVNQVGTPVLYAGNLGKKVTISGHSTYKESYHEKEAKKFVEMYGKTGELKSFANFHLGLEFKRTSDELKTLFSWDKILSNRFKNNFYLARSIDLLKINSAFLKEKSVRFY